MGIVSARRKIGKAYKNKRAYEPQNGWLQSYLSNWATWKRVHQSEFYLRTQDSNLFVNLKVCTIAVDKIENLTKSEVLQTYQETYPFVDRLVSTLLDFVDFSMVLV